MNGVITVNIVAFILELLSTIFLLSVHIDSGRTKMSVLCKSERAIGTGYGAVKRFKRIFQDGCFHISECG